MIPLMYFKMTILYIDKEQTSDRQGLVSDRVVAWTQPHIWVWKNGYLRAVVVPMLVFWFWLYNVALWVTKEFLKCSLKHTLYYYVFISIAFCFYGKSMYFSFLLVFCTTLLPDYLFGRGVGSEDWRLMCSWERENTFWRGWW